MYFIKIKRKVAHILSFSKLHTVLQQSCPFGIHPKRIFNKRGNKSQKCFVWGLNLPPHKLSGSLFARITPKVPLRFMLVALASLKTSNITIQSLIPSLIFLSLKHLVEILNHDYRSV